METNMTYESAFAELTEISHDIENETISVDQLAEKVKRASELITFCQTRLRITEEEVSNIIKNIENKTDN